MSSVATYISARTLVNEGRPQGSAYLREWVDLRVNQVLALILFALLSPLLLVIMGFIWRSDGAPLLFAHYRVGRDGRLFRCLKFRSMRRDASQVLAHLLETDPEAAREWRRDHKLTRDRPDPGLACGRLAPGRPKGLQPRWSADTWSAGGP